MFWLIILLVIGFSGWIYQIKSTQKAQLLLAEQKHCGVLINRFMLDNTPAKQIIESLTDINDIRTQLGIAAKSSDRCQFFAGTLKSLTPMINEGFKQKNEEWVLITLK